MTRIAFAERDYDLPAGLLTVRSTGHGRPLLHLHSAGGPRASAVLESLAERRRILCPVAPGFSGTPRPASLTSVAAYADLLSEFLAREGDGALDVVGESFGGWTALWLAARHPRLVAQMALEAPAGFGVGPRPADGEDAAARRRRLYAFPDRAPGEWREPSIVRADADAIAHYRNNVEFDHELAALLPAIEARTLVLLGAEEKWIAADTGRFLKSRLARAHLIYVYEAGHALEIDQPAAVARVLIDFFDRGESFIVKPAA